MIIYKRMLVYRKHTIKDPDKLGEVVDLDGLDLKEFWRNPVLLYGDLETVVGRVVKMKNAEDGLSVLGLDITDEAIRLAVERGDLVPVLCFSVKNYDTVSGVQVLTDTELLALTLVPKDKAIQ